MVRTFAAILLSTALVASSALADGGKVVVTVKPLHSLVASVMKGDSNTPELLLSGAASPHTFTLKPSQVKALQQADVVFYIGEDFERFLHKLHDAHAEMANKWVAMQDAKDVVLLPVRSGEAWEKHQHAHDEHEHEDHDGHEEETHDMHFWLDPTNARVMVRRIAHELSVRFPQNAVLYNKNATALEARLTAMEKDIKKRMQPLSGKPFIVFHDAYQYFERAYGVHAAGAVTLQPDQAPGAAHLKEIRGKIKSLNVTCMVAEPAFDMKILGVLSDEKKVRTVTLDPEGLLLEPGEGLYEKLMGDLSDGLERCLQP